MADEGLCLTKFSIKESAFFRIILSFARKSWKKEAGVEYIFAKEKNIKEDFKLRGKRDYK